MATSSNEEARDNKMSRVFFYEQNTKVVSLGKRIVRLSCLFFAFYQIKDSSIGVR